MSSDYNFFPEEEELNIKDNEISPSKEETPILETPTSEEEVTTEEPTTESSDRIAGKDGSVRDVAGAVENLVKPLMDAQPFEDLQVGIRDFVDNTFQGDQRSKDEIKTDRQTAREDLKKKGEENKKSNPVAHALADTVLRAPIGARLGFFETGLEFAELVGDTTKTALTTTLFPSFYKESDNPLSDKYDWAKWDLGKDDIGAQTGTGKIAQGFIEFGMIMHKTGGFASLPSAGRKLRTLQHLQKTSKGIKGLKALAPTKAQWLTMLRSGTAEGVQGLAADLISSASGEGNLSNLIRDHAPEWYPTWARAIATSIAIDEDDNPFEAGFKTALEGFGLGHLIGTFGASFAGIRAIKKAPKNTPVDELQAIGLEATGKKLQESIANDLERALNSPLGKAFNDVAKKGDEGRVTRYELVLDQLSRGIPVTYDDIAGIVPEYFEAGARAVDADFHPSIYQAFERGEIPDGGAITLNPFTGESAYKGSVVSIDGEILENPTQEAIATFIAKNKTILSRDDVYLNIEKSGDNVIVELTRVVDDADEAVTLGKLFDQERVIDIDEVNGVTQSTVKSLDEGGNTLKDTKGDHLSPSTSKPSEPNTTNPTKVYKQGENKSKFNGGGTERTITNKQLYKMGKSRGKGTEDLLRKFVEENLIDIELLAKEANLSTDEIANRAAKVMGEVIGANGVIDFSKIPRETDTIFNRVGTVAIRGIIEEVASNLYTLGIAAQKKADLGQNFIQEFELAVANLKVASRLHKISANQQSKLLSSNKIATKRKFVPDLNKTTPEVEEVLNKADLQSKIDDTDKVLDDMVKGLKSGDPKAKREALRTLVGIQLSGGDIGKTFNYWQAIRQVSGSQWLDIMYNSMLSAPTTHIVNTLSNAINTVYRPFTLYWGGNAKHKKQALKGFYNFQQTINDSWEMAGRAWKENQPINKGDKGFKQTGEVDEALEKLNIAAESSDDLGLKRGANAMNLVQGIVNFPLFSWPSRLLTTSDEFFKVMVARMEYSQQIMGRAIDDAEASGKSVDELFDSLYKSEYRRNFTPKHEILNNDLLNAAKEVTFQQSLDGMAKNFGDTVHNIPLFRPFFPFVKTGHNIMVYSAQHTPLLSRHLTESRAIMESGDEYAIAMLKGKQAVGRWIIVTGGILAISGGATGNGPREAGAYKVWAQSHRPRSLKIPFTDRWLDYSRIEPLGTILSATCDVVYAMQHYQLSEKKAEYLLGHLMYSIGANITNKSFLQGLIPLGQLLTPNSQQLSTLANLPAEMANNFFPLASARRTFANIHTPYMMEFDSMFNRTVFNATGGIINLGAENQFDWLSGENIGNPSGGLNALNPLKVVKRGNDKVRDGLEDIGFDSNVISKTIVGIDLTAKQKVRMQELMGTLKKGGLYKELDKIITSPAWKKAVNNFKSENTFQGKSKKNQWFYNQVERTVLRYRDLAIAKIKSEDSQLRKDIIGAAIDKQMPTAPNNTILPESY